MRERCLSSYITTAETSHPVLIHCHSIALHLLDLSSRDRQPEVMDQPQLQRVQHTNALNGLARIHRVTGTASRLWGPIYRQLKAHNRKSLTVLDVGCGDGFLLRQLFKRARRQGFELKIAGCDFSERALDFARQAAEGQGTPPVDGPWKRHSGALWYGTTERIWRPIGTALLGPVTRRNWFRIELRRGGRWRPWYGTTGPFKVLPVARKAASGGPFRRPPSGPATGCREAVQP